MLLKRSTFFRMLFATLIAVVVPFGSGCAMWSNSEYDWSDDEINNVVAPGDPPQGFGQESFFGDRARELDRRMGR